MSLWVYYLTLYSDQDALKEPYLEVLKKSLSGLGERGDERRDGRGRQAAELTFVAG